MTASDEKPEPDWVGGLLVNERILWRGRPPGRLLPLTAVGLPFVFGWVVLALAVAGAQSFLPNPFENKFADKTPVFLVTSGIVAVGVYLALILSDVLRRHRTRYALSNFRAFIGIMAFGRRWLDVYPINAFMPLRLDESYAGGTVWFADQRTYNQEESMEPWQTPLAIGGIVHRRIGFVGIPDYRAVFALMRQIQNGAT